MYKNGTGFERNSKKILCSWLWNSALHSQRRKEGLKCRAKLPCSHLLLQPCPLPLLAETHTRRMGSFHICERDRPGEKLLLPATGPFKPVQESVKSASYSLCSHTLLPGLQLRGRDSKTLDGRADIAEGLKKYQEKSPSLPKSPSTEFLDFRRLPGLQCCSPTLLPIDPAALLTQLLSLPSPVSISQKKLREYFKKSLWKTSLPVFPAK